MAETATPKPLLDRIANVYTEPPCPVGIPDINHRHCYNTIIFAHVICQCIHVSVSAHCSTSCCFDSLLES